MPTTHSTKYVPGKGSNRDYSHPSVVALLREGGEEESEPEEIVRRKCREIVASAKKDGWEGPPFDPFILASLLGIKTKRVDQLPKGEARLLGRKGEPIIEYLRDSVLPERLRFTICHEIAHTVFPDGYSHARSFGASPLTKPEAEFERLCDAGAAELLMPLDEFKADLDKKSLSLEHVCCLKRRYEASIDATTNRCLDLTHLPHAAVFFHYASLKNGEGSSRNLTVKFFWPSKAFRVFIRPGMCAPRTSVIHQALLHDPKALVVTQVKAEFWMPTRKVTGFMVQAISLHDIPGKPDCAKVMALIAPYG